MKRQSWHTEDSSPHVGNPSKSQVKRDLNKLQDFGLRLLEITPARFDTLVMEDELREAVLEMRALPANARRRQAKYVGKLLRDVDLQPFIREFPENRNQKK